MNIADVNIDALTPRPGKVIAALPDITLEDTIAVSIKTVLGWAMIFTIVAVVVAGAYYIQSRGNEDDIKKAKDILRYLAIGIAIMAAAYGIVAGLAQFEFF